MAKKLTPEEVRRLTHGQHTRYPRKIEDWYAKQIKSWVKSWQRIASRYIDDYLARYVHGGNSFLQDDDDNDQDKDWADAFDTFIKAMSAAILSATSEHEIKTVVDKFVKAVDNFSYVNVKMQAGAVGLNPIQSDAELDSYVKIKLVENTHLVLNLRDEFADKLQTDIYNAITKGGGSGAVRNALVKRAGMTLKRADLIANDQTGTIIGQLNAYRHKKAGANRYIWQSQEDERVRPKHQVLDRTVQKYDDPDGGDDGEMPGEPIRCRCVADPIFD